MTRGASAVDRATGNYRQRYGTNPTIVVRAPGRVNLIGEHTDYNDGFVLPIALPFEIAIAAEPRADTRVLASSEGFEPVDFSIDDPIEHGRWHSYVHGTGQMLIESGYPTNGWRGCLASDVPAGASLSSSAALEIASGLAFVASGGDKIAPRTLARICQRVENDVLGFPSGIMDQLASAASTEGTASLIDCRHLTLTAVPVPDEVDIVIMDTGTRRRLAETEYAARQTDCQAAAAIIGVQALRDATLEDLDLLSCQLTRQRARHVISENMRTLKVATALRTGDVTEVGQLMNASHASLRDDFQVSGPALDRVVELAQLLDGCLGARMTGGGFAGAAVALVERDASAEFIAELTHRFGAPPEQPSTAPVKFYPVRPAAGASVITQP